MVNKYGIQKKNNIKITIKNYRSIKVKIYKIKNMKIIIMILCL